MKIYEVVCISCSGGKDISIDFYLLEDDALQRAVDLDIISLEDPCRQDYYYKVREIEVK